MRSFMIVVAMFACTISRGFSTAYRILTERITS